MSQDVIHKNKGIPLNNNICAISHQAKGRVERCFKTLQDKKASGIKLGRPKGTGKSKLDEHKEDILKYTN